MSGFCCYHSKFERKQGATLGFRCEGLIETYRYPRIEDCSLRKAIEYIEARDYRMVEVYFEQANMFSVWWHFRRARPPLVKPVQETQHPDVAQQRFPDMSLGGRLNPPPENALESKHYPALDLTITLHMRVGTLFGAI